MLRRQILLWLVGAIVAAGVLGYFSTRAVVRPIGALHRGATQLEKGNLEHRVSGESRSDELGDLARAFNRMAGEIQRWNRELESRVEEKASELANAQEMLLRAHKLAAVAQLGAGVWLPAIAVGSMPRRATSSRLAS